MLLIFGENDKKSTNSCMYDMLYHTSYHPCFANISKHTHHESKYVV